MCLYIKRIQTDVTPPAITIFPARYEDRERAEWALTSILATYWRTGKDRQEREVWWAREKDGQTFIFVIECETAADGADDNS